MLATLAISFLIGFCPASECPPAVAAGTVSVCIEAPDDFFGSDNNDWPI